VADEDEDESPAAQPNKDRNRSSQEFPEAFQLPDGENQPQRGTSTGTRDKPSRAGTHIYETLE